jgi:hypothetical protein
MHSHARINNSFNVAHRSCHDEREKLCAFFAVSVLLAPDWLTLARGATSPTKKLASERSMLRASCAV